MVEVEPHRTPHEVHPFDNALLVELRAAEREASLLVASRDSHLIAHLRSLAQHQVLPVRPPPGLERPQVLRPEENRVSVRTRRDARGALVTGVAVSRGVALELGPLRAVHHRHAPQRLLGPRIRMLMPSPGLLPLVTISTPGTRPLIASMALALGTSCTSSPLTDASDPVTSRRACVP